VDACPGRLNEVFLRVNRPCHLFGQCSEICGVNHAFMPIHVQVGVPLYMEEIFRGSILDLKHLVTGPEGVLIEEDLLKRV